MGGTSHGAVPQGRLAEEFVKPEGRSVPSSKVHPFPTGQDAAIQQGKAVVDPGTLPSGRSRTALDPGTESNTQPQASPGLDGRFPIGADSRHHVQCHGTLALEFKQVDFGRAFVGFCFRNPCVTVAPGAAGKRHTEGHQRRHRTGPNRVMRLAWFGGLNAC